MTDDERLIGESVERHNRRVRRRRLWAAVDRWLARVLIVLLVLLAIATYVERQQRSDADRQSVEDRRELAAKQRVVECTIRGVLELSRDRAQQQGRLDPASAQVIERALAPLEDGCPPLVTPSQVDPPPQTPRPAEGGA
ncbi:hypothetical protein [Miltoncostaea marina]|uniref:hypothetical protein n=1 Tax=Miltoncostaea marina TaxID=2843215 RepID=UPI001C3D5E9A|nr:hypothetical protein [Miltoncostaea marina]